MNSPGLTNRAQRPPPIEPVTEGPASGHIVVVLEWFSPLRSSACQLVRVYMNLGGSSALRVASAMGVMMDDELQGPLGLGTPQAVPVREKNLPLKLALVVFLVAVLIVVVLAAVVEGAMLGLQGIAAATSGSCAPPTASPDDMVPDRALAASVDAMPGVQSATPSAYKKPFGICPNPSVYASAPWITEMSVTMNGDSTVDQVNAVATKLGDLNGSTITLEPSKGESKLVFTWAANSGVVLPVMDARRIGAVPGVTNVYVQSAGTGVSTKVSVVVDQADAASSVRAAFEAAATPWGPLNISDGHRYHETFTR